MIVVLRGILNSRVENGSVQNKCIKDAFMNTFPVFPGNDIVTEWLSCRLVNRQRRGGEFDLFLVFAADLISILHFCYLQNSCEYDRMDN